jgi:hypothetical protein
MDIGDKVLCDLRDSHGGSIEEYIVCGTMKYSNDVVLLCSEEGVGMPCGVHALTKTGTTDKKLAHKYRERYFDRFPNMLVEE